MDKLPVSFLIIEEIDNLVHVSIDIVCVFEGKKEIQVFTPQYMKL